MARIFRFFPVPVQWDSGTLVQSHEWYTGTVGQALKLPGLGEVGLHKSSFLLL